MIQHAHNTRTEHIMHHSQDSTHTPSGQRDVQRPLAAGRCTCNAMRHYRDSKSDGHIAAAVAAATAGAVGPSRTPRGAALLASITDPSCRPSRRRGPRHGVSPSGSWVAKRVPQAAPRAYKSVGGRAGAWRRVPAHNPLVRPPSGRLLGPSRRPPPAHAIHFVSHTVLIAPRPGPSRRHRPP